MKGMLARPLVAVALVVVVIAAMLACNGSDTVVFATDGAYHPFNFVNDDGEIDGLERELGDELCRRANLECGVDHQRLGHHDPRPYRRGL